MEKKRTSTQMPELFVFAKALALGFVLAEIFRVAYIGGGGLVNFVNHLDRWIYLIVAAGLLVLLLWYAISRNVIESLTRLGRSRRIDLLATLLLGAWSNDVFSFFTQTFHDYIAKANPLWAVLFTVFVAIMIASSLIRALFSGKSKNSYQLYFLTDDEIQEATADVLANSEQATQFAQTVLASGSNNGLVYGIDGPWGTGKTSFINLASNYWKKEAADEVIIFRFEPLRYASDSDLAERFMRDLSAEIQRRVFVPEFKPAATRYSRMLKGKADFSFFGFKLALEPSAETIDELLEDVDEVLRRTNRRLIVVVDDLDRLEAKAVNNVLFTIRRTFRLTQATYILCFDTENLVASKEEGERARQFLEKFINIKLSLFVDSSSLCRFLRKDWRNAEVQQQSIPSETMFKLASIVSELASIFEDKHAARYMALIGDLRKLKRFVNAVLLMQIEKTDLARTDFNRRDLINLMLLHLNYPGIFRQIYVQETEGRSGVFSITTNTNGSIREYVNAEGYKNLVDSWTGTDGFLIDQLFGVETLQLGSPRDVEERVRTSRACFNSEPNRNLEKYLKLIVRFVTPEPQSTFKIYQDAVTKVIAGVPIKNVLSDADFDLKDGENSHDQFWRILVNRAYELDQKAAQDSIDMLVEFLPIYSSVDIENRGLRSRCIYSLILLLDRVGWMDAQGKRRANTRENIIEIAHRIFGEEKYSGNSIINRLISQERGVLGWFDLMLFRLQCSADRKGQIYNLHSALIVHENMKAETSGLVAILAITGMRVLSQRIFAIFESRYIAEKINILEEFDAISEAALFGAAASFYAATYDSGESKAALDDLIEGTRSSMKSFVFYQMANRYSNTGAGIGCGYYDKNGAADGGEISVLMNKYAFEFCFNPEINSKNTEHFLDYCLCNLTNGFWLDNEGYYPTQQGLVGGWNADAMANYWAKHGEAIKNQSSQLPNKRISARNYAANYSEDLPRVFEVLDNFLLDLKIEGQDANEANGPSSDLSGSISHL